MRVSSPRPQGCLSSWAGLPAAGRKHQNQGLPALPPDPLTPTFAFPFSSIFLQRQKPGNTFLNLQVFVGPFSSRSRVTVT